MQSSREIKEQPNYIKSLYSGYYSWGNEIGKGVNLNYCFIEPTSNDLQPFESCNTKNPYSLNLSERNMFKQAASEWASIANINLNEGHPCQIKVFNAEIPIDPNQPRRKVYGLTYYNALQPSIWDFFTFKILAKPRILKDTSIVFDFIKGNLTDKLIRQNEITISHELGHALGLSHGFESTNIKPYILSTFEHSNFYSLMNYENTQPSFKSTLLSLPQTPTAYDIATVQYIYGARKESNIDSTIYKLSNYKNSNQYIKLFTLWDAGGVDTIDASGLKGDATINLSEGPQHITEFDNINLCMAYGSNIENVIGGPKSNTVTLNSLNNVVYLKKSQLSYILTGYKNTGKDILIGFKPGRDLIYYFKDLNEEALDFKLNDTPAFDVEITNQTMHFKYGLEIETTQQDKLILANVKSAEFHKSTIRELDRIPLPSIERKSTINNSFISQTSALEFLELAWGAFINSTFTVFMATFSEDIIRAMAKEYKWPDLAVNIILETLKSMLEVYTGTWLSAGISRLTAKALNYIPGISPDSADYYSHVIGTGINAIVKNNPYNSLVNNLRSGITLVSSFWGGQVGFFCRKKISNAILPKEIENKSTAVNLKKLV